ncbi:MAG: DUF4040 domain-containing protein [Polyangiaceae bacterium]|nr:DUF4040 domain-containing protein [Polyangiaceae bacterium]
MLVLQERDLKRILAWSTVSSLGTLILLIGLPGEGAATATAAFLVAHALYKAPLFFVAGNVDHSAGTRDIGRLAGLARCMPWTAVAALLAGMSMAGVPLSFGFVAKDLIKIAKAEGDAYVWVAYGGVLVSALSIAVAAVAAIRIFWHRGGEAVPCEIAEVPRSMRWPPVALASLGIVFGVLPRCVEPLLLDAARAMRPGLEFESVRAGVEGAPTFTAFGFALILGLLFFLGWDRLHAAVDRLRAHVPRVLSAQVWYEWWLASVPVVAGALTRRLQTGVLRHYVTLLVLFVLGALALTLGFGGTPTWPPLAWPSLAVGGTACGILIASVGICVARDPFVVLLISGLLGLGCALLFLFLGAPDVAFTQFAVEVAFVVVIASILLRMRRLDLVGPRPDPVVLRLLPALGAGAGVAALTAWAVSGATDPALRDFFSAKSLTEAHGRNVVNVVLVDFRALDTLGEVSVVAVAFLAALPLLQALRRAPTRATR